MITEIKIIGQDAVFESIKYFLSLGLINRSVKKPVFEGNKFDIPDEIHRIIHKSACIVAFGDQTEIRLLHDS